MAKRRKKAKVVKNPIGVRLRGAIKARGITIVDFAAEAKIPHRTLYHYLSGPTEPSAAHLARLSEAGIDLHWLLTGKRPMGGALSTVMRSMINEDVAGADQGGEEALFHQDADLFSRAWRWAVQLASEFHERWVAAGGKLLPLGELMVVGGHYITMFSEAFRKASPELVKMLKSGSTQDELLALIAAKLGPQADAAITDACRTPAWD